MKSRKNEREGEKQTAGRKPFLEKPRRISMLLNEKQFDFCKKNHNIISVYVRSLIDREMQQHKSGQIAT